MRSLNALLQKYNMKFILICALVVILVYTTRYYLYTVYSKQVKIYEPIVDKNQMAMLNEINGVLKIQKLKHSKHSTRKNDRASE